MHNSTIRLELQLSDAIVESFAELTGDRSSLHTDDAFARRSRFRERVAHGMLTVASLAALTSLHPERGQVRFESIKGHFREPVRPHDRLLLCLNARFDGDMGEFSATWTHAGHAKELAVASGRYRLTAPADQTLTGSDLLSTPRFEELDLDLDALEGRTETIGFATDPRLLEQIESRLLIPMGLAPGCCVSPELLAVLMLSTLVGMRLPGRRAVFLRFALDFEKLVDAAQICALSGTTQRVQRGAELLSTDVTLTIDDTPVATGSVEALVTSPPANMPNPEELASKYLDLGLQGRVALVVGGSRGIGEVTAKFLAKLGARVALSYHRGGTDAEKIVESIRAAGGTAACFACDVRSVDQVAATVDAVADTFGGIDILVNCFVGRFDPSPTLTNHWDDYLEELEISVKGVHTVCSAVVPLMRERGAGKIVNFSTVAVHNPVSGQSRYATAKGAVEAYTRNLAKELIRFNIQANLVIPNMTETDLLASVPRTFRDRMGAAREYGRHVYPAEVAQAVAFLASQWSNAMTGQSVVLNLGEPPFG